MNSEATFNERMNQLKTCVIIPTYNNHKTVQRVIEGVLKFTSRIIVVNDGSTDATVDILNNYPQLILITIPTNKGKGNALRTGFIKAIELGFNYAITIDSDGQHFPSDIPVFLDALVQYNAPILLIGNRNMSQDGIPKKSSFGNNFSNFWFWFETGIKLQDTQSGYRLYPLQFIPKKLVTNKFELEIEVIVRTAWNGIPVSNVPINILYDPKERVSHFRPFTDFTRISILNTILVIITLFYIKPRNLFYNLKKKSLKEFVKENILESDESNLKKVLSMALGVFIGIAPFWGFQTVIVLALAYVLRLNKLLAFTFSNISFPPFIPFIIFASLKIGEFFISIEKPLVLNHSISFSSIQNNLIQYIIGSFVLASFMAVLFGVLGFLSLSFFSNFKNKK